MTRMAKLTPPCLALALGERFQAAFGVRWFYNYDRKQTKALPLPVWWIE